MTLFRSLNYFFQLFYLFGLSPKLDTNHSFPLLSILPTIIFFIFYSAFMAFVCYDFNSDGIEEVIIDDFMTNFFFLCNSFMLVIIFPQTFVHRNTSREILYGFYKIYKMFAKLEQWHIEYSRLLRSFSRKFVFEILFYLLSLIAFIVDNYPPDSFTLYASVFKLWQFMSTITFLNLVFYIDILRFHLNQINLLILKNANCRDGKMANVQKLNNIKIIFYNLWELSLKVNHIFGWTIFALLFQAFFDIVYVLYWIFIGLAEKRTTGILRMLCIFYK